MFRRIFQPVLFLSIIFSACNNDPCKDVICSNGIPLPDGRDCVCLCEFGWDGKDCTVEDKCRTNKVFCVARQGTCNSNTGQCQCLPGFEGDSCQIVSRDRFLDNGDSTNWIARDTCLPNQLFQYTATIKRASLDAVTLLVYNLINSGANEGISVRVTGFEFEQRFSDIPVGGVVVNDFTGKLSANARQIRVIYSTDQANLNCRGVWTRN